ncbi:MAG: chemotaxis protein CheW [Methanoregulaceae archaeon]
MAGTIDIVEFELGGELYALDIQLAREIVEMIPITPIPRAPPFINGIINLRGEITTIINLYTLLGLPQTEIRKDQKIIILVPESAGGNNVGIIVDEVHSVNQVPESSIEKMGDGLGTDANNFVKGIIKIKGDESEGKKTGLIIWIDMLRVLKDLVPK